MNKKTDFPKMTEAEAIEYLADAIKNLTKNQIKDSQIEETQYRLQELSESIDHLNDIMNCMINIFEKISDRI